MPENKHFVKVDRDAYLPAAIGGGPRPQSGAHGFLEPLDIEFDQMNLSKESRR